MLQWPHMYCQAIPEVMEQKDSQTEFKCSNHSLHSINWNTQEERSQGKWWVSSHTVERLQVAWKDHTAWILGFKMSICPVSLHSFSLLPWWYGYRTRVEVQASWLTDGSCPGPMILTYSIKKSQERDIWSTAKLANQPDEQLADLSYLFFLGRGHTEPEWESWWAAKLRPCVHYVLTYIFSASVYVIPPRYCVHLVTAII